jgi:hypothetical protein
MRSRVLTWGADLLEKGTRLVKKISSASSLFAVRKCSHPCLNDSADKERSISVADYMFIRSFSPFPTNTGAELHGECTTVECRPLRMSPCFQARDRFCSTFALLIISMKRHKSQRYGGSWCAEDGFSFEQKKLILLKTGRVTLKAIIG